MPLGGSLLGFFLGLLELDIQESDQILDNDSDGIISASCCSMHLSERWFDRGEMTKREPRAKTVVQGILDLIHFVRAESHALMDVCAARGTWRRGRGQCCRSRRGENATIGVFSLSDWCVICVLTSRRNLKCLKLNSVLVYLQGRRLFLMVS